MRRRRLSATLIFLAFTAPLGIAAHFADVIEGAYPAQFGERFGGVVNITTRSGSGPAGFNGDIRGGSYNDGDATIGYHAPLGPGGGLAVAVRNGRSTRGLDGPDFDSPHNAFSDSDGLVHATLPLDAYDSLNATLTHTYSSYQIPNYVSSGEPAATNDNETQEDSFATFQFRHSFGDRGLLTFGPALKISRIRDFGDPLDDFAFGKALNLRAGGGTTDCATALQSGNFGPMTCKALLIASGIRADGYRDILGLSIGDAESFVAWDQLFRSMKSRGLKDVDFVVSGDHAGLRDAIAKSFVGTTWQRCQVHVMRNLLEHSPTKERKAFATAAKLVFAASDRAEAQRRLDEFVSAFSKTAPKAVACMEAAFDDALAVLVLPEKYRRRLRSTNMQERLNEEVRRRERVIRIFPNDQSALRIFGALLAETNDDWRERAYFDMEDYHEWKSTLAVPIATAKSRRAA